MVMHRIPNQYGLISKRFEQRIVNISQIYHLLHRLIEDVYAVFHFAHLLVNIPEYMELAIVPGVTIKGILSLILDVLFQERFHVIGDFVCSLQLQSFLLSLLHRSGHFVSYFLFIEDILFWLLLPQVTIILFTTILTFRG